MKFATKLIISNRLLFFFFVKFVDVFASSGFKEFVQISPDRLCSEKHFVGFP